MTIPLKHFIAACLVGALMWVGLIAGAHTAFATENDSQGWYTWNTALQPGVTDPKSDADVTWPQALVGRGQIAPECGQWVQQDRYEGSNEAIEAVVGDGRLDRTNGQPEDHAIVRDWKFVYGGDCAPEPTSSPSPTPTVTVEPTPTPTPTPTRTRPPQPPHKDEPHSERHVDCDLGLAIVISEVIFVDYEWNEDTWSWDEVITSSNSTTEQEPLTAKEKKSCPTNSTPTPSPTTKPSETPSSRPTPSPTTSVVPTPSSPGSPTSTPRSPEPVQPALAETGTDGVVWFVASLGLIGLGATLVLMNRRKNDGY